MNIMNELEKFLISEIAIDLDLSKQSISPDEDLISSGIIDSMGILKLTAFMEKTFGIKLTDDDIVPENFRTVNCLYKFIELKQEGKLDI